MECWHCERPAHAVCKFCGRGVCKAHTREKPYILHTYRTTAGQYKGIVVGGAVWCGVCRPQDDPVPLENLD